MIIAAIAGMALVAGVLWMAVTWQANRRTDPPHPAPQPTEQAAANDARPTHGAVEYDITDFGGLTRNPPTTVDLATLNVTTVDPATVEIAIVESADDEPKPAEKTPAVTTKPIEKTPADKTPTVTAATAKSDLAAGLAALADYDLLQARSLLSRAVLSGKLTPDDDATARDQLTQLVEATLWSTQVIEDDPYTYHYRVQSGQTLVAIERGEKLHVPTELLLKVNKLATASALRAGANIKLIRGPFHAVIRKSEFMMDIYLHRDGLEKIWITQLPIGTGRDGSTPEGLFQVGNLKTGTLRAGKLVRPTWTPTESSELRGPIAYGRPGYALGTKGLWIGLAGMDDETRPLTDYAIHSTDMPDSIGKEMSSGCIRLADTDIDTAWSLLYETWSTVRIVK